MAKIAYLNVSAPGHIIPTYGLVKELTGQGHEIHYWEVPRFQQEIESFGAVFHPYPEIAPYQGPLVRDPFHNELDLGLVLSWCALEWTPKLLDQVRDLNFDLLIHDSLCLWGRLLAHTLNIPAVATVATAALNYRCALGFRKYWLDLPGIILKTRSAMSAFRKYAREICEKYKLPRLAFLDTFAYPEDLNIVFLPPELQPRAHVFDKRYHFVGAANPVRSTEYDLPLEQLQPGKTILISFGNLHNPGLAFFQNCLEAFKNLDYQVIMLLSPDLSADQLGPIPPNFIIRRTGTIPQLEVLKRCALFVMHGGGGGAREGAWLSVPMLAFPQTFEQYMISRQIKKQGAGLLLDSHTCTSQQIKQAALKILNDSTYSNNARRLSEACRLAGGAQKAADLINQKLSR